jgi:molybdopterin molybdotransferase
MQVPVLTAMRVRRHIGLMDAPYENRQRIERLTPLEAVLRHIERSVSPIGCSAAPLDDLLGATLAADVVVPRACPEAPVALIDGFAVRAEWTAEASPLMPAVLSKAADISAGQKLPAEFDAVMPAEAVTWRDGNAETTLELQPGDGVLVPGTDAGEGEILRRAGDRLRAGDLAAMRALGIGSATIRRPRIGLTLADAGASGGEMMDAALGWLRYAIAADGAEPVLLPAHDRSDDGVAILFAAGFADAIVIIGGTGAGPHDRAIMDLSKAGTVAVHGIAISPGESAAFGTASRPVLLVPGRLDAALAAWLLVGRTMLARLRGGFDDAPACEAVLTTKVVSTIGVAELVLVRRAGDGAEPLAAKYLPPASLAQADGFIVVPPGSEGFPPGQRIAVRPLP